MIKTADKITVKQVMNVYFRAFKIINEKLPNFFILTIISAFINAIKPFITLFFSAKIINQLLEEKDINLIVLYVSLTIILNFLLQIIDALLERKLKVQKDSYTIFYETIGERYMYLDYHYVEDNAINDHINEIAGKAYANGLGLMIVMYSAKELFETVFSIILSILLMVSMFSVSGSYTMNLITSSYASLLVIVIIIVMLGCLSLSTRWMYKKINEFQGVLSKLNSLIHYYEEYIESNNAAKDLRLYDQKDLVLSVIEKWKEGGNMKQTLHACGIGDSCTSIVNTIFSGVAYVFVGLRALYGMYSIGSVVQYVGAITNLFNNVNELIGLFSQVWLNIPYLEMMYQYLDLPNIKYQGTIPVEKRRDNEYNIEFHDVSFKYPNSHNYALKHINLKFEKGQRLAVVGMNGSGKSTMIKLLCRLYDPTEGLITLNGIDIKKYNYDEYMKIFSTVFQDFKLFGFSLAQNVATSVEYDESKVYKALDKVGFNDRTKTLPNGLSTYLYKEYEEDGVTVSGGEAQKIALARALYKDAAFMVLDEPTSALDPIAEYEIYAHMDQIVEKKTAVYISHRLSSCRFCDDIAVFDKGELVQRGNHEELVKDRQGKYYELWNAQAMYYAEHDIAFNSEEGHFVK